MITDGTSKVYLFGEKYMDQFNYTSGWGSNGDEETLYIGMDDDNIRLGATAGIYTPTVAPAAASLQNPSNPFRYPPQQDAAIWPGEMISNDNPAQHPPGGTVFFDYFNSLRFGSAHSGGFNMAFCDGSVHTILYEIDPTVHAMLCDRQDGKVLDPTTYLSQ